MDMQSQSVGAKLVGLLESACSTVGTALSSAGTFGALHNRRCGEGVGVIGESVCR